MPLLETIQFATLVVLALDALGVAALIALKSVNRARRRRAEARKRSHMRLISRHVSFDNCTDPIPANAATDPAFIDALIEVRNALAGSENVSLGRLISRHGVIEGQIAHLRASFPRARRLRAAMALAELGDASAVPALIEHLSDREPEIRIQAARGLGRIGWTSAIDAIVARFGTEIPWVRARFADTLVGFGSSATWPLIAYVTVNHRHETAGPAAAVRTLAAIGDEQAVPPLVEILHSFPNREVELAIIDALGAMGNPMAAPALRTSIKGSDWRTRAKAATALGSLADTQSLDLLTGALSDRAWWVRRNAAAALTSIPGGVDRLYEALTSVDRFAADAAAEALVDIGELTASRARDAEGNAHQRDLALIGHMERAR